jgi:hypothetical protein
MKTALIVQLEDETCRWLSLTCANQRERCTLSRREGEIEQMTRAEDEENSLAVYIQGPNVTAIILTEGLQLTDDVISHFLNPDHFIRTCLKFMHKMEAVMAEHEEGIRT